MATDQKGAAAKSAWLVFFDESGISLIPPLRRSWSPRGRTPILRHRYHWKRASMAAALGYRHDHTGTMQARLCFHLQPDSYDTDSLIGVLEQLAGFYAGHKVVLLWDGLSSHWSYKLRAHLDAQRDWLTVERLPAYAPELNPAEYLWANLKGAELANFGGDTIAEVADQAQHGIQRVCDSDSLVVGFLAHTGLSMDDTHHPKVKESISIRAGRPDDAAAVLVMPDEAVRWLIARGRRGQWGDQAFSAQPEWVAKVRHWAAGDGLWIGELGGVPAGAMVLGAARPYVPTVSEPEVYGEGRTERIDERYPAARR